MKRLLDILILGVLFLGAAALLDRVNFWGLAGLDKPHGYVAQGLMFLLAFFLFSTFLFDPYLKVLEERKSQTVGKKKAAEKTRADAEAMLARYRSAIDQAQTKAIHDREALALAAEEEERKRIQEAKAGANGEFARNAEALQGEEAVLRKSLQDQIQPLALEIAEKVLTLGEVRPGTQATLEHAGG